jgi:hypothetical protein
MQRLFYLPKNSPYPPDQIPKPQDSTQSTNVSPALPHLPIVKHPRTRTPLLAAILTAPARRNIIRNHTKRRKLSISALTATHIVLVLPLLQSKKKSIRGG